MSHGPLRTVTAPDDLALAQRCAAGERAAQRELFSGYSRRVHATLYRVLGSNREMEDLVQEALLETFRSLPRYRGEAKLSTWIDRISARVAYGYLSRKKPSPVSLDAVAEPFAHAPSAEQAVLTREGHRRLYGVLGRLAPKYRIAFALHVVDGRPLREVAEITESSLVAVKTRVSRARREVDRRARKDPVLATYVLRRAEAG